MATIDRYERGDVPFLAWLLCVARNVAIDDLRRRRPIPREEVGTGPVEGGEPDWLRPSGFREAVALLQREQRSVLVLRHVLGLSQGRSPSCWARARAPYTPFTIAVAARSGAAWPSETWRPL